MIRRLAAFLFLLILCAAIVNAQWVRTNWPYGGTVQALAVSGTNLFAGTGGSGVFLSTNNGTSWTPANSLWDAQSVISLAVSGTNLYAGNLGQGVLLSTNNGTSWTQVNSGLTNTLVFALAVSGTNLFAGTGGGGVFLSTNNGASWGQTNSGLTNIDLRSLVFSGTNLFAGTNGGGVFLSTNNGTSWTQVNSGLTNMVVLSFAVSGTNLFAGTYGGGVFLSTNNGTSWTQVNSGLTNTDVRSLTVSGTNLFAGTNGGGVFLSTNNGTSWTQVNSGLTTTIVFSLAVTGSNLFAGTNGGGVFLSTNNGTSWTQVNSGLMNTYGQSLAVSGTNIFAGTNGAGVFLSSNNGTNWTQVNSGLHNMTAICLAVSGTNLFDGTWGNVYLTTDNGTSWTSVNNGLLGSGIVALAVGGTNLFAGSNGAGVFFSTNNGTSWTQVNSGLTNTTVQALAVSGTNVFAGTWGGGVFLSTNNGTSWTQVNSGLTNSYVQSLAVSGTNVFAGTWGDGVFLSTNNGTSWTQVKSGLTNTYVLSLAVSAPCLFCGTYGGGVFFSTNNGTSWYQANNGLTNMYVHSIAFSGTNLFAGTNDGVFEYVNYGTLYVPTIASITSYSGPIGAPITIYGTNFSPLPDSNFVYFGAVRAPVISGSANACNVNVPLGSTYAPISVTNKQSGLTVYSTKPFAVTFPSSNAITSSAFATKVDFTTGNGPRGIATGDFDNDGKPDIAVANYSDNTITFLRNTSAFGTITFSTAATPPSGTNPVNIAAGDLDGDGKQDVVATNLNGNSVSIYRNLSTMGNISFAAKIDSGTAVSPYGVAIGDVDGDGKPDVVVANIISNSFSVLRNTSVPGSISFATKVDFATGTAPYGVAIADINNDGLPDVVITNRGDNTVSVFRNSSAPGNITFLTPTTLPSGQNPNAVATGDLDGDGMLDLATSNIGSVPSTISVLRNTSSGGSISFAAKVDSSTGLNPYNLALGDFDGDGKPDISVIGNGISSVSVHRNTSTPGLVSLNYKVDFATGTSPRFVAVCDVDGDGKPDLIAANFTGNTVSVLRNTVSEPVTLLSPIGGERWNEDSFGHTISWQVDSSKTVTRIQLLYSINNGQTYTVIVDSMNNTGRRNWQPPRTPSTTVRVKIAAYNAGVVVGIDSSQSVFSIIDVSTYTHATRTLAHTVRNDGYTGGLGTTDPSLQFPPAGNNHLYSGNLMLFAVEATGDTVSSEIYGDDYLPSGTLTTITGSNYVDTRSSYTDKLGLGITVNQRTIAFTNESFVVHSYRIKNQSGSSYSNFHVAMLNDFDLNNALKNRAGYDAANQLAYVYDAQGVWQSYAGMRLLATVPEAFVRHLWTENLTTRGALYRRFAVAKIDSTSADTAADYRVAETLGPFTIPAGDSVTVTFAIAVGTGLAGLQTASQHAQDLWNQLIGAPVISTCSPLSGPVGSTVTITGANFSPIASTNIVYFGAVKAIVSAATPTSLTVTVPVGATYAPITVTNQQTGLTACSSNPFVVTFPGGGILSSNSFAAKVDFAVGDTVVGAAISDLDGDGKPDLAVVNHGSNAVSVFRNTSISGNITGGSFAAKVDFATGSKPDRVAVGDLDGDGKPDMVVTNGGSSTISVFRNTSNIGNISFAARLDLPAGSYVSSVAIKDLDKDGKPDLAVVNWGSNTVSVYRNTSSVGNISFAAKIDFTTGNHPWGIAAGDLDGDGDPDLAVTNQYSHTVSLFRNISSIGNISFAPKVDFVTDAAGGPNTVAIGDLDGDGKPDLAVTNWYDTVSVLRNTSLSGSITGSSFAAKVDFSTGTAGGPYCVAISDLDGDGKPDLVITNWGLSSVSVFRNTSVSGNISSSSFGPRLEFASGNNPATVAIGDLDGDGKADLAVANWGSTTVSVLRNTVVAPNIVSLGVDMSKQRALGTFQTGDTIKVLVFSPNIGKGAPAQGKMLGIAPASGNDVYRDTVQFGTYTGPVEYKFWKSRGASDAERYEGTVGIGTSGDRTYSLGVGSYTLPTVMFNNDSTLVVTSVSPSSAYSGNQVNIYGYGFSTTPANNAVKFGTISATVASASKTVLSLFAPTGVTGSVIVSVTVGGVTANSPTAFTFLENAPSAPTNLVATAVSPTQINLGWTASSSGSPTRYRIYRSFTTGAGFSQIDSVSGTSTTYNNLGLTQNTMYYYRVYGVNSGGMSSSSNEAYATTAGLPPSAPTSLTATALTSTQINLTWNVSSSGSPSLYRICRSLSSGTGFTQIDSVNGSTAVYSNTGLTPGTTYYYVLYAVNAYGVSPASNQASATTLGTPPPAIPSLTSPSAGASAQPIIVTFTWSPGAGTTPSSYRLQVSVNSAFSPLAVDDSTNTGPQKTVSALAYGTTYYWRVRAQHAAGNSAYTATWVFSTVANAAHAPSTPIMFPTNPTSSTDYRLVSFPGNVSTMSVGQVLGGSTPGDWILTADNGAATSYFVQLSASSTLSVGQGYWLIRRGSHSPSYSTIMPSLASDGTHTTYLHSGWNIIGNPFNVSVSWSAVQAANGIPSIPIYSYSGTSTYPTSATLQPFVGYYFDNRTAGLTQLKIPYPFPALIVAPTEPVPFAWKVQLVYKSDINEDQENYIGISPRASSTHDSIDTRKPPLFKDLGFLYFSRPDWDAEYEKFNGDFRKEIGDGQVWDFDVSNPRRSRGTIRMNGLEGVPSEYQVTLINLDNTTPFDARANNEYDFRAVKEKTRFKLIVGKNDFVRNEVKKYIPTNIALFQNYPNPFNPSTTISFALPYEAAVRVEVVNILGQRVAQLVDGRKPAGLHSFLWEATGSGKGLVPSGVYFCRLVVDGKMIQTRKLILTK